MKDIENRIEELEYEVNKMKKTLNGVPYQVGFIVFIALTVFSLFFLGGCATNFTPVVIKQRIAEIDAALASGEITTKEALELKNEVFFGVNK